ncbi:hypothetical protein [Dyella sp. ASV21]|uniref:hypothetical protein n=1 Tax=Dyella sp. ASV21 TaxID=2795114 RepID=UPI0018ED44AA|nr:hypothetical protein [Dyella sp. ASV21]
MGVEALVDRFHQHRALVVAGVALLVSLEAIAYKPTSVPVEQWRDRIQTLRSGWDADKGRNQTSIIYGLSRPGEPWLYAELDTMMLAQDMGVATVNGYSGNLPPDFGLPDACATGVKRLAQGAAFNGWPTSRTASLIPRLKVLPETAACPDYSHLQPFAGALSEDTFRHTTIAIVSQDHDDQAYTITVSVTNKSDHYLPAVSLSNDPVQLSWQFVPESQPVDMAAWTTRMPLEVDVAAGNTLNQKVPVQLPTQPGRYQIVFSLVQDGVSWFHDKGMPLAVGAQIIEVPAPR